MWATEWRPSVAVWGGGMSASCTARPLERAMDNRIMRCGTLAHTNQLPLRRLQSAAVLEPDSCKQLHSKRLDLYTILNVIMCCHLANLNDWHASPLWTSYCRCFDETLGDRNGLFDDQSTVLIGASSSTGVDLRPFRGSISGTRVLLHYAYLFSAASAVHTAQTLLLGRGLKPNSNHENYCKIKEWYELKINISEIKINKF